MPTLSDACCNFRYLCGYNITLNYAQRFLNDGRTRTHTRTLSVSPGTRPKDYGVHCHPVFIWKAVVPWWNGCTEPFSSDCLSTGYSQTSQFGQYWHQVKPLSLVGLILSAHVVVVFSSPLPHQIASGGEGPLLDFFHRQAFVSCRSSCYEPPRTLETAFAMDSRCAGVSR